MFGELLFSLSGRKGLLLTNAQGLSQMNIEFLHPSEEEILSKILVLGRYASDFQDFVDRFNVSTLIKNHLNAQNSSFGYYEAAFADGVQKILTDYRSHLIRLETNLRTTPSCRNLIFVNYELREYHSTFPVIELVLDKIKKENIRGCFLLNIVWENLSTGISSVNEAFDQIRRSCNQLFSNHILEWLKYGSVDDKYNEFFIQKFNNDRFTIRTELCPNFVPAHLREKLFFIGDKSSLIGKEQPNFDAFSTLLDENCAEIRSILIGHDFDPIKLERPIERIRKALSEKLWSSVVNTTENNNESLFYCLNLIKDYFFLGKGELYLALIDEIDEKLVERNVDLNKILQNSVLKMYGDDGTSIANNVFRMHFRKFDVSSSSIDCWDRYLDLSLTVSTKLKLIFDDHALTKCRQIFHFLLKIRRIQTGLNKCWTILLKRRRTTTSPTISTVVEGKIWRINNLMLFLINNLQYYLHVDVLDSFYKLLLTELIHNVNEFQRASDLFNEFVRKIGVSCFFESKEISKLIDGILGDCEKFAVLIVGIDQKRSVGDADCENNLGENIQKNFIEYERHSSLLFKILSTPKTHLNNPHLLQLLNRLDYNSYFSSTQIF